MTQAPTDNTTPPTLPATTGPTQGEMLHMNEKTMQVVIILFSFIMGCIALGGAAIMGVIILRDGNGPLVQDIAGKFTIMVVAIIFSITMMVTGKAVVNAFISRFTGTPPS